jgi:hypothetical protein
MRWIPILTHEEIAIVHCYYRDYPRYPVAGLSKQSPTQSIRPPDRAGQTQTSTVRPT